MLSISTKVIKQSLASYPLRVLGIIFLWTLFIALFGLGSQEFLRHTEADRTLIAWEMLDNGNFLVPTLLGSDILTKPPLFYWLSALSLYFSDPGSEFSARLPSVLAAVLFVVVQFVVWFNLSGNIRLSAISALALGHSVLFFILSTVAEIDMLFGFLASSSISLAFFVLYQRSLVWIISFAIFTCLAFLAKGPPVYFFLLGSCGSYFIAEWVFGAKFKLIAVQAGTLICSILISFLFISIWLVPLGYAVGWEVLAVKFKEEVFNRVVSFSDRERGSFFYFGAVLVNTLPWSIFLLVSAICMAFKKGEDDKPWPEVMSHLCRDEKIREFAKYSALVVFSGFMMLSMAQGKSSRYCFPILSSFLNLVVLFGGYSLRPAIFKWFAFILKLVTVFGVIGGIFFFAFTRIEGIPIFNLIWSIGASIIVTAVIFLSSTRTIWRYFPVYICLCYFAVRVCNTLIYIPYRNETRSVKGIAASLVSQLKGQPLYTMELFERWTVYYAKKLGLVTYRLSPEKILEIKGSKAENILLLLDFDEESWRYFQASSFSSEVELVKVFPHPSSSTFLLRVPTSILDAFLVIKEFPTHPSIPFYPELKSRGLES